MIKSIEAEVLLQEECVEIEISNEMCFFLFVNGQVAAYNVVKKEFKTLEDSSIFQHISCTFNSLFGVTLKKIYQLVPEFRLIFEFPSHQKIKKISSGFEHSLILTFNGDVFGFGCSLRGQLGNGDLMSYETPKLMDAVGGIKIIDIACGGFHSAVVSSFGDLYTFGFNTNGQLGIEKAQSGNFESGAKNCQQVYTLPQIIELEDDDSEQIKNVYCGHKSTIIKTSSNRLFSTGLNNYGQLGIDSNSYDIDKFTEIPIKGINEHSIIKCGFYTNYLIK